MGLGIFGGCSIFGFVMKEGGLRFTLQKQESRLSGLKEHQTINGAMATDYLTRIGVCSNDFK
jgi:hypothetical protein